MFNIIRNLAVACALAGLPILLSVEAPKANAADGTSAQVQTLAKADRLPIFVKGTACSKLGWPYYEQGCLFDDRVSADEVRTVRIIALR
jgi:hypothetical protein